MHIGPHTFSGRFFLAPLAGVSDRPFRAICREMGAAFAYTEMVSAHGLVHGTSQTLSYLDRDPAEVPFAVQIFAAEPEVLARGAAAAVAAGAGIVDINMACPVRKVCGTGAGAALARDPAAVEAAVREVVRAAGVPVTIKIRAGWDDATVNCVEVARAAEAGGASRGGAARPDPLAGLRRARRLVAHPRREGGGLDPGARARATSGRPPTRCACGARPAATRCWWPAAPAAIPGSSATSGPPRRARRCRARPPATSGSRR